MKWLCVLAVALSSGAWAGVSRGGFGLLYPDANSLANPGATAQGRGFSAEVLWAKYSGTHEQTLSPSVSWANGRLAVAAYASRYGMSLTEPADSEEAFGVGLGLSLDGGWTAGVSVDRTADPHQGIARGPTSTAVNATLGWHAGDGFSVALSAGQRLALAVGWRNPAWRWEMVGTSESLGAFGAYQGQRWYVSFGGKYVGGGVRAPQALLRVGVIYGSFDLSTFVTYVVKDRENPFHGGALRLVL